MSILLADFTFNDILTVLTAISVAIIMTVNIKNLFWPSKPIGQQYVEQHELDNTSTEVNKKVDDLRNTTLALVSELKTNLSATLTSYVTRSEYQKVDSRLETLAQNHKELADYTHDNVHNLLDKINAIALRIETMHRSIDKEMSADRDRILEKIENTTKEKLVVIEKLFARIEYNSDRIIGLEAQINSIVKEISSSRRD